MEHIVQFGINLDDEAIAESIVRKAGEEVRKELNNLNGYGYYDREGVVKIVKDVAEEQVKHFLKEHTEEIVALSVKEVANSIVRTKVFKESAKELANDVSKDLANEELWTELRQERRIER